MIKRGNINVIGNISLQLRLDKQKKTLTGDFCGV